MASPSSRPRSDSSIQREDVSRLLRDGAVIRRPGVELIDTARRLQDLGLITFAEQKYVKCADPQDSDFRYTRNRSCPGRINLHDGLDEAGHDYRCPECERPVFPYRTGKRRHTELRVELRPDGIHRHVGERVAAGTTKELCRGMFRVELGSDTVHVCVADICGDERYLARDWAHHQPTLYLAVDERTSTERFLAEDWLAAAVLADVVCGEIDLVEKLGKIAGQGPPGSLANVSIPVYRTGPPLIGSQPRSSIAGQEKKASRAAQCAGLRPDGVYPPRTVVFRGVEHDCELTDKECAFLAVALPNAETDIGTLMHGGHGAVWREPYVATTAKRNKVSGLIARLNAKVLKASPPLRVTFGLRRGQAFVYRQEPPSPSGDGATSQ